MSIFDNNATNFRKGWNFINRINLKFCNTIVDRTSYFMKTPPPILPNSFFKYCANPLPLPPPLPISTLTALFVALFLWLNGWSLHIWQGLPSMLSGGVREWENLLSRGWGSDREWFWLFEHFLKLKITFL